MIKTKIVKVFAGGLTISSLAVYLFLISGCGGALRHTLSPSYEEKAPYVVAVMPVGGNAEDKEASYLFRTLIQEKLIQKGYSPVPLEVIDDRLTRSRIGKDGFMSRTAGELAKMFGADAILYTTITEWKPTLSLVYASMKIGTKVELYDGLTSERLWEAEFGAEDSDISFERDVMDMGILKAYEPVIQRVVDALFSTIPDRKAIVKDKKGYYDWLP